jgi:hypothetical protein
MSRPMSPADVRAVAGVAESALPADVALPDSAPPAPWTCRSDALVWYARSPRSAAPSEAALGGRPVAVFGGFVQYADTPVGTYGEVFGGVALLDGRRVTGTIPFMAVDSPTSVVGGRANWALPKTLARFDGSPSAGAAVAHGPGWTVRASARVLGPAVPMRLGGRLGQRWPDGVVRAAVLRGRARMRPALVTVEVVSDGPLPSWLRPGRHLGAVLTDLSFTLPEPR